MIALIPWSAMAEETAPEEPQGEVIHADQLDEFIDLTLPELDDASFLVDKTTGRITGTEEDLTFEEAFGEDFDEVRDNREELRSVINETEGYQVEGETAKKIQVLSDYGLHRVMVSAALTDSYGAETAVVYSGETLLTYDSEESTKAGYEALLKEYGPDRVQLDSMLSAAALENNTGETFRGWGTPSMHLDYAKEQFAGSDRRVTIAVLDTGIDPEHEIFDDTVILNASRNFSGSANGYLDDHGHGTRISGIIAESTPRNVRLLVLKVMNSRAEASWFSVKQALNYAAANNADIVNLSLGNFYDGTSCAKMDSVLSDFAAKGMLIFAASGNKFSNMVDSQGRRFYPAASPYVISVGAVDQNGKKSSFSNYGAALDFVAPGEDLTLARYGTRSGYESNQNGSSFSSPYVCAAAAYLLMASAKNTPDVIESLLCQISDDLGASGKDIYYGNGMPNFINDDRLSPVIIKGKPTVDLNYTWFEYNGKNKRPRVKSVTCNGRLLSSYRVTYPKRSSAVGSYKMKITLKGNYSKTVSVTKNYKIVPKRVTVDLRKSRRCSNGTLKLKWSRSQGTYQIRVSTSKRFRSVKKYRSATTSKTIRGLKKGRTYYIKVRAVKKVRGKNYYSPWSDIVYVKGQKR